MLCYSTQPAPRRPRRAPRPLRLLGSAMHPLVNIAVRAARRAGNVIVRNLNQLEAIDVATKGRNDFVTEVDRSAEQEIIATVRRAHPDHGFLAEESGASRPQNAADYTWIIDPLDGTTNFIHGFPQYAVSIACQHGGQITQAVIYDPNRNDLFTATRGRGAFLNDRRLRVSKRTQLKESLIGTGFPFRNLERLDHYLKLFKRVTESTAGMRRPGAASLDLAYVAAGRFDGFWEYGLSPWDVAAGALLVIEAGGLISDDEGNADYMASGNVVCGAPKIHPQLLNLIRGLEPDAVEGD
jgi:myo-inositol-1(or 4)-monophosphatase